MQRPRRLRRNTPARRDAGVRLVSTLTVGLTALGAGGTWLVVQAIQPSAAGQAAGTRTPATGSATPTPSASASARLAAPSRTPVAARAATPAATARSTPAATRAAATRAAPTVAVTPKPAPTTQVPAPVATSSGS